MSNTPKLNRTMSEWTALTPFKKGVKGVTVGGEEIGRISKKKQGVMREISIHETQKGGPKQCGESDSKNPRRDRSSGRQD